MIREELLDVIQQHEQSKLTMLVLEDQEPELIPVLFELQMEGPNLMINSLVRSSVEMVTNTPLKSVMMGTQIQQLMVVVIVVQ